MSRQFELYPAIDMRGGRCVRLRQGDAASETVFSDRPADMAVRWQDQGARWLHVVNLDGALASPDSWTGPNVDALRALLAVARVPVQFGGGIRSLDSVARLLDLGVERVILGTVAVTEPELVREAVSRFGAEHVTASLDARDGMVRTHGWLADSGRAVADVGRDLAGAGVSTVVHTDISRDGMLSGANVAASAALADATGLSVIVSGGVSSLKDVESSVEAGAGIGGLIIGQALYTGAVDLAEALATAQRLLSRESDGGD